MRTRNGWTQLGPHIGFHQLPGNIRRYVTNAEGVYEVEGQTGYLPARAILTKRPNSPSATVGLLRPWGNPDDYRAAGGQEISPCGDGASIHVHDSIMQRSPVALRDMTTGVLLLAQDILMPEDGYHQDGSNLLPGFPSNPNWPWKRYDLQHLIRAFRAAILRMGDPAVQLDLQDLQLDAFLYWTAAKEAEIMAAPGGQGSWEMGRAWAWSAYLACVTGNQEYMARMRRIAQHVVNPLGILQRKMFGSFFGSPDTWGSVATGGSGVDPSIIVAQDIECAMEVVALHFLGLTDLATRLFQTVFAYPKRKWIDISTGNGVGVHGADSFNVWFALPMCGAEPSYMREVASKWGVPRNVNLGGVNPPAATIAGTIQQLKNWNEPGKSLWAQRFLQGLR